MLGVVALLCLVLLTEFACNFSIQKWVPLVFFGLLITEIELPCSSGPLPCINFKDLACPAELPQWPSW